MMLNKQLSAGKQILMTWYRGVLLGESKRKPEGCGFTRLLEEEMRCLQNPASSYFPSISFGTIVVVVRRYNMIRYDLLFLCRQIK